MFASVALACLLVVTISTAPMRPRIRVECATDKIEHANRSMVKKLFPVLVRDDASISSIPFSFQGITPIIDIPLNTTHVTITQISPGVDRYYLAVRYVNGTYILNGMHSLQLYNSQIRLGSATLFYNGFGHSNESILITGRLRVALEIQVVSIYQSDPPTTEVHWEYYIPYDEDDFVRHSAYQSVDYQCDRPCQGHKQGKKCVIHETEYEPIYCSIFKLPFQYQTERCNDHCVLSWTARYQQSCSTRCGDGFKRTLFHCTKSSSMMETIDEDVCRKYVGEKPTDVVACIGDCTAIGWVYGDWGKVGVRYL
jgi:hypothetical protein